MASVTVANSVAHAPVITSSCSTWSHTLPSSTQARASVCACAGEATPDSATATAAANVSAVRRTMVMGMWTSIRWSVGQGFPLVATE